MFCNWSIIFSAIFGEKSQPSELNFKSNNTSVAMAYRDRKQFYGGIIDCCRDPLYLIVITTTTTTTTTATTTTTLPFSSIILLQIPDVPAGYTIFNWYWCMTSHTGLFHTWLPPLPPFSVSFSLHQLLNLSPFLCFTVFLLSFSFSVCRYISSFSHFYPTHSFSFYSFCLCLLCTFSSCHSITYSFFFSLSFTQSLPFSLSRSSFCQLHSLCCNFFFLLFLPLCPFLYNYLPLILRISSSFSLYLCL